MWFVSLAQEKFALDAHLRESWINFNRYERAHQQETSLPLQGLDGCIVLQNTTRENSFLCRTHQRTVKREGTVTSATRSSSGWAGWGAAAALPPVGQWGKKPNSFPDQKGFTCEEQQTGQDNGCSETPTPSQSPHCSLETPLPSCCLLLSTCGASLHTVPKCL